MYLDSPLQTTGLVFGKGVGTSAFGGPGLGQTLSAKASPFLPASSTGTEGLGVFGASAAHAPFQPLSSLSSSSSSSMQRAEGINTQPSSTSFSSTGGYQPQY